MITIALTGGIGSGKSTAAAILKELGATVIDSDSEAHRVLNSTALPQVTEVFGSGILTPQGTVDRKKLAQIVFGDPDARVKLNKIIHTLLDIEIVDRLKKLKEQGTGVTVIELALASQAPWISQADYIWIVQADKDTILERLKGRGMSREEALARIETQKKEQEGLPGLKIIIKNNGSIADLKAGIEKFWRDIHNEDRRSTIPEPPPNEADGA
ncbi:MAG: dephospho-CoA kinase [Dehalococcoidales bacterium]|nr:dephospho-CoA kinase [Dehalococcoidales bacterium]